MVKSIKENFPILKKDQRESKRVSPEYQRWLPRNYSRLYIYLPICTFVQWLLTCLTLNCWLPSIEKLHLFPWLACHHSLQNYTTETTWTNRRLLPKVHFLWAGRVRTKIHTTWIQTLWTKWTLPIVGHPFPLQGFIHSPYSVGIMAN